MSEDISKEEIPHPASAPESDEVVDDIEKNKDVAAFSYVLVFAPVLLITRRDSMFIKFHALQAVYLGFFCVLFAILPGRLSYLNIIIVAGALMGFLEAQGGHYYKIPVVSDLIGRKISLQLVYEKVKWFFLRVGNTIKRIFTEGPGFAIRETSDAISRVRGVDVLRVNSRVDHLDEKINGAEKTVRFLERELLLEKYLKSGALSELSEKEKKELLEAQKMVLGIGKKVKENASSGSVSWMNENGEVIAGAFSKNAFWIYFSLPSEAFQSVLGKEKCERISFGSWNGIKVTEENFSALLPVVKTLSEHTFVPRS